MQAFLISSSPLAYINFQPFGGSGNTGSSGEEEENGFDGAAATDVLRR